MPMQLILCILGVLDVKEYMIKSKYTKVKYLVVNKNSAHPASHYICVKFANYFLTCNPFSSHGDFTLFVLHGVKDQIINSVNQVANRAYKVIHSLVVGELFRFFSNQLFSRQNT